MYRALVIGAGNIGARFDNIESKYILTYAHGILENPNLELAGFIDFNKDNLKNAIEIWGGKPYKNLEDAMKDEIDIVIIAVSDKYHYEYLKKLHNYSNIKAIIVEKPIATSIKEIEEIQQLYSDEMHEKIIVNYTRRFIPEIQKLRNDYRKNIYGKVISGTGYYGKGLIHNGSHMVDFLDFFINENIKVSRTSNYLKDFGEDYSFNIDLEINEDAIFSMKAIDSRIYTIFEIDMFFEKARIQLLNGGELIKISKVSESDVYSNYKYITESETIETSIRDGIKYLLEHVVEVIENKANIISGIDNGIKVAQICMQEKK